MKRCFLTTLSCLILLVSSQCYGPVFPKSLNGTTLDVEAPLFISDYGTARMLFWGVAPDLSLSVGFMHIALLAPRHFEFMNPVVAVEGQVIEDRTGYKADIDTYKRSLNIVNFADSVESTLVTNRRVIVHVSAVLNGGKRVRVDIFNEQVEFEAGEFGIHLARFFKKHNMEVSEVDLLAGYGDMLGQRVFNSIKMVGMKNFVVRCFRGTEVYISVNQRGKVIRLIDVGDDRETIEIEAERFFRTGQVLASRDTRELLTRIFVEGNPVPSEPPPIPPQSCTL